MDFGSGREDFCEDEANLIRGKLLFPSSSSYPSPSQYTRGLVAPFSNGPNYSYQHHNHHNQRGWLENRFDASPQEESSGRVLELMEVSQAANNEHDEDAMRRADSSLALAGNTSGIEKEHMFDKVVTPSDVGKLNRLVIPKQHAEKYFPLDSSTNEKGLLLNFEDRSGKPWRFRYSYWNSSQSYVMTKGWSRFVKEKKLDAGDIVSFQRGVGELGKDRLYIDWRRRPNAPDTTSFPTLSSLPHNLPFHRAIPWNPMFLRPPPQMGDAPSVSMATAHLPQQSNMNYHLNRNNGYYYSNAVGPCHPGSVIYLRSAAAVVPQEEVRLVQVRESGGSGGTGVEPMVFDSVPVVHGKAAAKRLRLFGVNMECPIPESDECDTFSSSTTMAANNSTMVCQLPNQLSSSSSPFPPLVQSRLYNGIPLQTELLNKGKSSMSFDLDI